MDEPYISVIVTTYNRRKYLLGAVNSILSQNFPRHLYEIIVVKNLRDEAIDSKLQEWGVVNLYSDQRGLGAKIVEALGIARGDVISFLEDETSSCWASINAFTHPSRRKGRWTSITTESSSSTRPGGSCAWEATDH